MKTGASDIKRKYPKAYQEALNKHNLVVGTPRTDAVMKAALALPWGSAVVVPEGHPPTDPWQLARELEQEVQRLTLVLSKVKGELDFSSPSTGRAEALLRMY